MATTNSLRERLGTLSSLTGRWRIGRRAQSEGEPHAPKASPRAGRWRPLAGSSDELLLVPQDPRTPDPSFASELALGQMGLAGMVVDLGGHSPFDISPPSEAWAAELHAFGWLRHLAATGAPDDRMRARRLVADWLARPASRHARAIAWRPDVTARRAMSWLANATLLLDAADAGHYRNLMQGLDESLRILERTRRRNSKGPHQITVCAGLTTAALALAGHQRHLARSEHALLAALEQQILADGGHVSRNPALVLDNLLDLLPLRQCYQARGLEPPSALLAATQRMVTFLNHVRLGDGSLARFNGTGRIETDALATVLAIDQGLGNAGPEVGPTGFVRLARGATIVVADCGSTPAEAERPFAGCLSFEMTDGPDRLVCNGGMPRHARQDLATIARATASHSTLALAAASSLDVTGRRRRGVKAQAGPAAIAPDGSIAVAAEHDGYVASLSIVHRRRLTLSGDGDCLRVLDTLAPPMGALRTVRDIPFAIHIHLSPEASAQAGISGTNAIITLGSGARWRLDVQGARAGIEPARDFAHLLGVVGTRQVVLRGATPGETTVEWSLTRLADAADRG